MEIKFNNYDLKQSLNLVKGGVENNTNHQILASVLFEIKDNTLTLNTNDSELEIKTTKKLTNNANNTKFTLKLNDLLNIVLRIDDNEDVIFILEDDHIKMINQKNKFILNTLNNENFHTTINENELQELTKVDKKILLNLIKKTSFSIANDNPQQFLNGLFLEITNNEINAITSDGHRLSIASYKQENQINSGVIIPKKTISEISKLLEQTDDDFVEIAIDDNNITLKNQNTILKSKLIGGNFPDYKAIIPKNIDSEIIIDKESFKKALKQSELFTGENKTINLEFNNGELAISANSEKGNAKTIIDFENFSGELKVSFNVAYLIQTLQNISEEKVVFAINSIDSNMLVLYGENNPNDKYLIMSVKI
jgi:DNA polymerase-3 subunit beta